MSARFFVDLDLSINDLCNFVWTRGFDRTFFAAFADICVDFRDPLSDNPDIIQIRFDTVVRTAAYCDLEFMRQCDIAVSFIKTFVDFLGDRIGIQKSILAGCSLAGYHRTDFCSRSSCHQSFFCDELLEFFNLIIRDSLDLYGKSRCIQ